MLVLSRSKDQRIVIGDNIVITVVEVRGDKVRLGIEAPKDVPVHRREVYEAIRRHAQPAAPAAPVMPAPMPPAPAPLPPTADAPPCG
jgi:carbon storage regulator